jgi:hypothetical protein
MNKFSAELRISHREGNMLTCTHYCTLIEEIFLINLYGTEEEKKLLADFLSSNQGEKLKAIITIAGRLRNVRNIQI